MTSKQRALVKAIAEGMDIEDAARAAGYGLAYAKRLLGEPAVQAVIENLGRARREKDAPSERPGTPSEILWEIIKDPLSSPEQQISAIRALIMYDRMARGDDGQMEPPTIIDDIGCVNCPYREKEFTKENNVDITVDG